MVRLLAVALGGAILGAAAMSVYDHHAPPRTHIATVCDARGNLVYSTPDGRLFVLKGC